MDGLRPVMVWQAGGRVLDSRLLELLRALQRHPTLKAAASEAGLSYRGAWGLLADGASLAGAPLVAMQRGRGARLSALGTRLLRNDEELRRTLQPVCARFEVAPSPAPSAPMRLAASHDPLLAEFCERFAVPAGLIADVSFRGSEESLALFSRGAAEVAGFHLEGPELRRAVRPGRDSLVLFAGRDQGLLVAPGNPKRLHNLRDVAAKHARFVNRQRGSGTRRHIDRLMSEAGLATDSLRGYATEEHTHLAVAATIATGRADAGFGVHAAATHFGLDFVPVLREQYWLALRSNTLHSAPVERLLEAISGKPLARIARKFPGYDLSGAGSIVDPRAAP